jgi:hypothetical protein
MTALFSLATASMAFVQHQPSLKMHIPLTRTGAPCCLLPPLVAALAADVAAGGLAAVGCAPLVACTDQAITLNANGGAKLWPTLIDKMKGVVRKPVAFFSSAAFVWLWFVYFMTYAVANATATLSRACGVSPTIPVLVCSTIANMGTCVAKDAAFARMLSRQGEDKPVPVQSYVAWFGRDIITMGFVFTLPTLLAARVPDLVCRLAAPLVAQYFTTPLHLLGLAYYNLPAASPLSAKLASVSRTLGPTVFARQFRILPAFSLGGVANTRIKAALLQRALGA